MYKINTYKRKSSGRKNSEDDDVEEHSRKKIRVSEEALEDDDYEDDDDDEEDDDIDNDEEDEDENSDAKLKNQKGKGKTFTSHYEDEVEKKGSSIKNDKKTFAYKYMLKHGYKDGKGLGKLQNGIVEPVEASKQKGTRGLGYEFKALKEAKEKYDSNIEDVILDEEFSWLVNNHQEILSSEHLKSWVEYGPPESKITEESPFCETEVIRDIINSKNELNNFSEKEKKNGRRRSNPFESICNAIFLNRAAMKMANMDAILDKMFTEPRTKSGEKVVGPNELLYFADVCAGPGGFSEYVLYRKKWRAKGFGFTLKNENDFKLEQFIAGPSETFEPHYGKTDDGDVFVRENIISFRDHVMKHTDNKGVHFMMADGGIHIEDNLCDQEIICKKLYLCQCIVALLIVRPGGHFVVKLFDLFTEFSVGLIYLMYRSFQEILLLKPNTSRPANSERYLICKWKRSDCDHIAWHLLEINDSVPRPGESTKVDVLKLVPIDVLKNDEEFFYYVKMSNIKLGKRQVNNLRKMAIYSDNTSLEDPRQQELRLKCLEKWNIPVEARAEPKKPEPRGKWKELVGNPSMRESDFCTKENKITSIKVFERKIKNAKHSWHGVVLCQEESNSTCGFYLGLGKNNVYRCSGGKFTKPNSIVMCLPANTIVYGEVVQEFSGTERSQTKISAFHIIDGLFLGGEDIRHLPFQERGQICALFAKALFKETCPVRVKERYPLGNIEKLWNFLVLNKIKSCRFPGPTIPLGKDSFYKAVGVMFIKDLKDQWNRYLSRTNEAFFVDNGEEKYFESDIRQRNLSASVYGGFETCFASRLIWWWDEGVVIFRNQTSPPDPNKMQRIEVEKLLSSIER